MKERLQIAILKVSSMIGERVERQIGAVPIAVAVLGAHGTKTNFHRGFIRPNHVGRGA